MLSNVVTINAKSPLLDERKLTGITLDKFLNHEISPHEHILSPWLITRSLNMLHAKRGVGKTHMGLAIAYAVATGTGFLIWAASKPRKVCYLDGEMSSSSLQSRFAAISQSNPCNEELLKNLKVFTPDLQDGQMPDIADPRWHEALDGFIDESELVIVDNLSCLARSGGNENDADSWHFLAEWALKLRREGKAVLFLHHSGKSGQQRGTSRKEDILNVVINLKHPSDYTPDMGAFFEVHIEKGRELYGEEAKPFIAKLSSDEDGHKWTLIDIEEETYGKVINLVNTGLSAGEVAAELNVHKSTVSRHIKAAKETGQLPSKGSWK